MSGDLCLQRTDQYLEFRKTLQISEAIIMEEKWPAGESTADAPFQPFKGGLTLIQKGKDASKLIVSVMCVSKGPWDAAGASYALKSLFSFPEESPIDAQ